MRILYLAITPHYYTNIQQRCRNHDYGKQKGKYYILYLICALPSINVLYCKTEVTQRQHFCNIARYRRLCKHFLILCICVSRWSSLHRHVVSLCDTKVLLYPVPTADNHHSLTPTSHSINVLHLVLFPHTVVFLLLVTECSHSSLFIYLPLSLTTKTDSCLKCLFCNLGKLNIFKTYCGVILSLKAS